MPGVSPKTWMGWLHNPFMMEIEKPEKRSTNCAAVAMLCFTNPVSMSLSMGFTFMLMI